MKKKSIKAFCCMLSLVLAQEAFGARSGYEVAANTAKDSFNVVGEQDGLGRTFYESVIESSIQRSWAVPISFYVSHANRSFDDCGSSCSLSNFKFGGGFRIRDVDLFSRVSDDNLVRLDNIDAQAPERGAVAIGPGNNAFGNFRDDLFTTLLANVRVDTGIGTEMSDMGVLASGMYRFDFTDNIALILGASLPFMSRSLTMDLSLIDGTLFRNAFIADQTQREDTLIEFFREYASLEDYFIRGILEPKGLTFANKQRKTGIGDFTLFGLLEFGNFSENIEAFQFGMAIVFPTSDSRFCSTEVSCCDTSLTPLCEISLGNGGGFQFDVFFNGLFNSSIDAINPTIRVVGSFSKKYTSHDRGLALPSSITSGDSRTVVNLVPGLTSPEVFRNFFVDPFTEFDALVPGFSGNTSAMEVKRGNKILVGVGNYFYNFFNLGFRLGAFYEYGRKSVDRVTSKCDRGLTLPCDLENRFFKKEISHSFSWNLAYKFENMLELNVGSRHVVSGRNVPRVHEYFCSLVAVF